MHDHRSIAELIADQKSGWSLEGRFYTDPEVYQLELDRIIMRNWIFAGHQTQLPEPGDFKVLNVAGESGVVIRSRSGDIKAFANVCRHRGSQICLEDSGNTKKFVCPYHGWSYDTDGNLLAARNMPNGFDKRQHSLNEISVELLHGLIFICFCAEPPSLEDARRNLTEPMSMFDFEHLKVAANKTYPIAANWKLAIENYQECYHCAPCHPEYARMHTLMLEEARRARVQGNMLERMPACGLKNIEHDFIDTAARSGEQGYGYSRTALFEGYKTGSKDGQALAPLLGDLTDYDGGASDLTVGHCSFFLAYSDHVVAYVFTPVDHFHCQCEIYWLVRGDAIEGRDYDPRTLMWLWDVTICADQKIITNNWKGVKSRYYAPGPLSGMEKMEQRWLDWIVRELK